MQVGSENGGQGASRQPSDARVDSTSVTTRCTPPRRSARRTGLLTDAAASTRVASLTCSTDKIRR